MSDIPLARFYIEMALSNDMSKEARACCKVALRLMTRASPVRRAPPTPQHVTEDVRDTVIALGFTTDLTMHEIANQTGITNIGRVSEIMRQQR